MSDERVLRVVQMWSGNVPTVESDWHIPVQITWVAPALGPTPVYVRVSGFAGGELEFDVERASGVLLAVTVLLLGAIVPEPPPAYPDVVPEHLCGVVIDRSLWERAPGNVIDLEVLLRPYRLSDGLRVDVAGVEPARLIQCGPQLTLAVDHYGVLASFTARIDVDERHFQT